MKECCSFYLHGLPAFDVLSDLWVYTVSVSGVKGKAFLFGSLFFWASQGIALFSSVFFGLSDFPEAHYSYHHCSWKLCWLIPDLLIETLWASFGHLVRVLKVWLLPLEPLVALGYYCESEEENHVVLPISTLPVFLCFTGDAGVRSYHEYMTSMPSHRQLYAAFCQGLGGWRSALRYALATYEHPGRRCLALIALLEEILENVGGILMAWSAFGSLASYVSILVTVMSLAIETGALLYHANACVRTQSQDRNNVEMQRDSS